MNNSDFQSLQISHNYPMNGHMFNEPTNIPQYSFHLNKIIPLTNNQNLMQHNSKNKIVQDYVTTSFFKKILTYHK